MSPAPGQEDQDHEGEIVEASHSADFIYRRAHRNTRCAPKAAPRMAGLPPTKPSDSVVSIGRWGTTYFIPRELTSHSAE